MRGARCLSVKLQSRDPRDVVLAERRFESFDAPIQEDSSEGLRRELDRRYLVAWSARTEAAFLDEIFCEGRTHWLRRTIDVRRLASLTARLSGTDFGPDTPGVFELSSVARRYRVPEPRPRDALDAAVMTAELFLILATKLSALGYLDVASLLHETSSPIPPGAHLAQRQSGEPALR
jgi:DNA polymerase III epsilon subunit-like protein